VHFYCCWSSKIIRSHAYNTHILDVIRGIYTNEIYVKTPSRFLTRRRETIYYVKIVIIVYNCRIEHKFEYVSMYTARYLFPSYKYIYIYTYAHIIYDRSRLKFHFGLRTWNARDGGKNLRDFITDTSERAPPCRNVAPVIRDTVQTTHFISG